MKKLIWRYTILAAVLIAAGGLWYFLGDEEEEEEEEEEVGMYNVMTITTQDYTVTRDFTTKIETEQPADIRPQVSGRLTKICVKEGATVKKGQPLFIIDQVPYQAAVRSAESRVNSAKAQLATARQNLEGKEALYSQHVIGDFDLNKARNELSEAEAAEAEAQADLATARNELSYTIVRSPSDGIISMIEYRLGELVDPMEQKGRIDAISGEVEQETGAIYIRASFDNPNGMFHNGSNGVLRLPYHLKDAIVIPQEATFEMQDRYFVYKVVDGVTHSTEIKVFPYNDGQTYAVTDGLKPGDVIIAEGAGLLKDEMKVKCVER